MPLIGVVNLFDCSKTMSKTTRKRASTTKNEDKSKNKKSRTNQDKEIDASDSKKETESVNNGTGEDDPVEEKKQTKSSKRPTTTKENPSNKRRNNVKTTKRSGKTIQVEAIVTHRITMGIRRYKVKLKDDTSSIWITSHMAYKLCADLVKQYTDAIENNTLVQDILSHEKKQKKMDTKLLLKWADTTKGETWVTTKMAVRICPNLVKAYMDKVDDIARKANAVTAILDHKIEKRESRYLVKWEDKKKGETWVTAKKAIFLCPEILDRFTMKNPDCVPVLKKRSKTQNQRQFAYNEVMRHNLIKDFDDDEVDWEVERIVDMIHKKDNTRRFLVQWKGFRSDYNSWLAEEDLNCPDLMSEFLERNEKRVALLKTAKKYETKTRKHSSSRVYRKKGKDKAVEKKASKTKRKKTKH